MKLTDRKHHTDWMHEAKYGIFFHYLYGMDDFERFDVNKFTSDVLKTGADYVVITLGQNSGYYCAPNPVFEELTHQPEGSKCYTGDIPMQIARALRPHGVRLMLYLPSHPPSRDNEASRHLGVDQQIRNDWVMNDTVVENWCKVIKYWSKHYGDNISGWWFDGFYPWINLNENYAKCYKEAVLSGNESSILALNQGLEPTVFPANKYCDYTAGEFEEFKLIPEGRFADGAQWHMLSYIGEQWCNPNPKYTAQYLIGYITDVNANGGTITIDMYADPEGNIAPAELEIMQEIKRHIKGSD